MTSGTCACGSRAVTVLFVDDDEDTRECYKLVATEGGLAGEVAGDGHEAILLASTRSPEVIVLDLGLRSVDGFNGFDVARRLRADARTSSIPIVIVSGSCSVTDLARIEANGYEGYLVKPCSVDELIDLVTSLALTRRDEAAARSAAALGLSR